MRLEELREVYGDNSSTQDDKVEASIKAVQRYMNTYVWETCGGDARIFLDDVLYVLGVALSPEKYSMGPGHNLFKQDLKKYLETREMFECDFDNSREGGK